ncbi:hypothetical protein CC79DRAFT_1327598 [Sarocladium strictum]
MSEPAKEWVEGIEGSFRVPTAVLKALPEGSRLVSAEKSGISAWTKTGKLTVVLQDGSKKRLFIKCITGQGARPLAEGEYESAVAMNAAVPQFAPEPVGWGEYRVGDDKYYFYVGDFYDMDLNAAPDPLQFASRVAELHHKAVSPNGMFGFHVPTVIGRMERTVTWERSWAAAYTNLLKDVHEYDRATNGTWPELDIALEQLYEVVIPRLLGVLQSEGRQITPVLVHGDLWENNVGIDMETGDIIIFDPGCMYAHNEMEFGTWRCSWTFQFNSPAYLRNYQRLIEPSEPAEEWDDRNRLYSLHPYLTDSAGHPGSYSRQLVYNDILYLCEKYGPVQSLDKYDPEKDIVLTGGHIPFVISQLS